MPRGCLPGRAAFLSRNRSIRRYWFGMSAVQAAGSGAGTCGGGTAVLGLLSSCDHQAKMAGSQSSPGGIGG